MTHQLAYLDQAVARAIETQRQDPKQFVDTGKAKKIRVAGIEVFEEEPAEARALRLESFVADAHDLRTRLLEASVTHIAILPTTAWDAIAEEAGLFRFCPDQGGAVQASSAVVNDVAVQAETSIALRPLVAFGVGALACAVGSLALATALGMPLLATAVTTLLATISGGYVTGRLVEARYFEEGEAIPAELAETERTLLGKLMARPREELLKTLWPDREAVKDGIRLVIGLPPAPLEAQKNLLRAQEAKLPLALDVVGEAIELPANLITQLVDARAEHWRKQQVVFEARMKAAAVRREQERAERAARRDPIVTTTLGSATAIIVQYGDFPLERVVVERVVNSSRLI